MLWFKNKNKLNYERRIKAYFRSYFSVNPYEGADAYARKVIPIEFLGITGIKFKIDKKKIEMEITLEKPGLLIGKNRCTISSVESYISRRVEKPFFITIKESNIWK